MKQLFYEFRKKVYDLLVNIGLYKYNLDDFYDNNFFDINLDEGKQLAEWFIPLNIKLFNFKSIADIGCGTGHYLKSCLDNGITDIMGVEGSESAFSKLQIDKKYVIKHDLRKPFIFNKKSDLALSIEVAEHIDKKYSDIYVKTLCDASDTIVMTAAPPGQGGTAHVNEQTCEWWAKKFEMNNYFLNLKITAELKKEITNCKQKGKFVTVWFEPNIMVFQNKSINEKNKNSVY